MTPDGPPILGLGRHRNLFSTAGTATWVDDGVRHRADRRRPDDRAMPRVDLEGLTVRR